MQLSKLPFSDKTITLYNKYVGKDLAGKTFTMWFRRVIPSCSWGQSRQSLAVGTTVIGSDEIAVKIPEDTDFLPYWQWVAIPNDQMGKQFTVNTGDVVVLGEVDDEIPYVSSATAIIEKYKGRVITARTAEDNTGSGVPLGHYMLTGK